jgi:CDP-glucose 4,6-dehydratase
VNSAFWRGKRVLLTGHSGFKGAWLSIWLHGLGAKVIGYALPPVDSSNLFCKAGIEKLLQHNDGDIRDLAKLKVVVARAQPEIVIHMAAQSLVRESYADPVGTFGTNVMGTAHLLEAIRHTKGVRAVVVVTSDKCYENREWPWGYREIDPVGGYDPYSSSKGCAELVAAAYRRSFFGSESFAQHGVAVASARAGNVIGGGDWGKDRLVPDVIAALIAEERPLIRYPHAVRPWQHVLDPLSGYLLLAEHLWVGGPEFAEAWNFGPSEHGVCSVASLVERICVLWGRSADWHYNVIEPPHEAVYLKLDSSKARTRLGWQPRWSLEMALARTIEVYRVIADGGNVGEIARRQIDDYSGTAVSEFPARWLQALNRVTML